MKRILFLLFAAIAFVLIAVFGFEVMEDAIDDESPASTATSTEQIAAGRYLTQAGNCMGCHTSRGGAPYAGGRGVFTPFGAIYSPNITPDKETGIGAWTSADFWAALHHGRSKDERLLYPAFPYTNYTKLTRPETDAIFAYLQTLPPIRQPNREHELRFPYNNRLALVGWRALYFRPGVYQPNESQNAEWNRGAYLVQGLGHCNACHTSRNLVGAIANKGSLSGGRMPVSNWYAPSLISNKEAGVGEWEVRQIVDLLQTGVSERGAVSGPMTEVVKGSLQHLSDTDAQAMAVYLKSLPKDKSPNGLKESPPPTEKNERILARGAKVYEANCAACHQSTGKGISSVYPPLAGNSSVTTHSPINAIRLVLHGGYAPSTIRNPRPYGMPPYGQSMNNEDVAAVVSYIRNTWGNRAPMVQSFEVDRHRATPVH